MEIYIKMIKSPLKNKKYRMLFYILDDDKKLKKIKHTDFGDSRYSDFTIHKDTKRRDRYLVRHIKNENWAKFLTAGSLSRWILWNKPNLQKSLEDYANKFNLIIL